MAVRTLIAAAVVLAGCHIVPASAPSRRCETGRPLVGAAAFPDELARRIQQIRIPTQAHASKSALCNRLVLEASPFALRHSVDPIDWRAWSPAALSEAEQQGRPLLVLSGFSAADVPVSFLGRKGRRRRVAHQINSQVIPVLVDRDERPDVDAYLMQATEVLTGGGGWPAVVFLEPDGRPFAAYSWGAAGVGEKDFVTVVEQTLRHIALAGTPGERADATFEKLQKRVAIDSFGPLPDAAGVAASLSGYLAASYDAAAGTFGPPPLFPRAPALSFLLHAGGEREEPLARQMAFSVLEKLGASALQDPARGGFFRYARRAGWQEPAEGKPLADNAALASAYLVAAEISGRQEFRDSARGIVEFLMTELRLPDGAFAASIARTEPPAPAADRNDAVLADANALAISALVRAARLLGEPRYAEAAKAAAGFVDAHLRTGDRIRHCIYPDGRACGSSDGYLSDHALVALAYLDLESAFGEEWLARARTIADALPARFEHEASGGFFQTASDGELLPLRWKPVLDTNVPSGNGAAALLYERFAARTGERRYGELCRRTLASFSNVLALRPLAAPSLVTALGEWSRLYPAAAGAADAASVPPQLEPAPAVHP